MSKSASFDVVIAGAGLGGACLALVLARHGARVLVVERERHPRFALGEAGIKETSLAFALLAARYGCPELADLASVQRLDALGLSSCGQKRSFTFLWHAEGGVLAPERCVQVGSPPFPYGADPHYFRADVDEAATGWATAAGAQLMEGVAVTGVTLRDDGVDVQLEGRPAVRARFFVDGTGRASPLAQALGLYAQPPPLKTHSYAVYTHLEGLPTADEALASSRRCGVGMPLSSGTLHHLFEGGWAWVIPFDNRPGGTNPLCSVGFCLDPRVHPVPGASPAEQARGLMARLPSMGAHLGLGLPARQWARTGRLQSWAQQVAGRRWALLPHAAGFVDPLFSRGLYMTAAGIDALAAPLLQALAQDRFEAQAFGQYERLMHAALVANDQVVATSYKAFVDFDLFNAWHRVWALGALFESQRLAQALMRLARGGSGGLTPAALRSPALFPVDVPAFEALLQAAIGQVEGVSEGGEARAAAARIFELLSRSAACPPPLGYDDPTMRHLAATGPVSNLKLRRWARSRRGPAELAPFFDYSLQDAGRMWWARLASAL